MVYKRWTSSTNGTHRSQGHWKMLSEDLEPRRGILSRLKKVHRYLEVIGEDRDGVEGIVLRMGGDVGRCGGSGKMVAI